MSCKRIIHLKKIPLDYFDSKLYNLLALSFNFPVTRERSIDDQIASTCSCSHVELNIQVCSWIQYRIAVPSRRLFRSVVGSIPFDKYTQRGFNFGKRSAISTLFQTQIRVQCKLLL